MFIQTTTAGMQTRSHWDTGTSAGCAAAQAMVNRLQLAFLHAAAQLAAAAAVEPQPQTIYALQHLRLRKQSAAAAVHTVSCCSIRVYPSYCAPVGWGTPCARTLELCLLECTNAPDMRSTRAHHSTCVPWRKLAIGSNTHALLL
jgi:hypothetical protein